MSATQVTTEVMDLTTTVRFTGASVTTAARIAAELDATLRAEIANQGAAAIREYFVRPVGETVQVGLRFKGMVADHVEATADEVLEGALSKVSSLEGATSHGKRTSTLLVGA